MKGIEARQRNDVWVTRLWQRDAICLTAPNRRIEIGLERCHDGGRYEGSLYFTTVDGHLVVVDSETLTIKNSIDLKGNFRQSAEHQWLVSRGFGCRSPPSMGWLHSHKEDDGHRQSNLDQATNFNKFKRLRAWHFTILRKDAV